MFRVKMCGVTRRNDALQAVYLGADMLGFIFYKKSRRRVSQTQARKIIRELPPVIDRVGVFVDHDVQEAVRIAQKLQLDFLQLHGQYGVTDVKSIQRAGFKVIQAYHIRDKSDYDVVYKSNADLILLDNKTPRQAGGTGRQFDWSLLPPRKIHNLMLAGGVTAENVEEGLRRFMPLVIDVNSGVEYSPGLKSASKMRQFFRLTKRLRNE